MSEAAQAARYREKPEGLHPTATFDPGIDIGTNPFLPTHLFLAAFAAGPHEHRDASPFAAIEACIRRRVVRRVRSGIERRAADD
jgi:hypothetical protein